MKRLSDFHQILLDVIDPFYWYHAPSGPIVSAAKLNKDFDSLIQTVGVSVGNRVVTGKKKSRKRSN
jgi:hypothetical protein